MGEPHGRFTPAGLQKSSDVSPQIAPKTLSFFMAFLLSLEKHRATLLVTRQGQLVRRELNLDSAHLFL